MSTTRLHFCHANGFPAGSYRVLLDCLSQHYPVHFLERHGHQPDYPITNHWPYLVDELIEEIKQQHSDPIIGIGHSMGGVLVYLAAQKQPELFKHIILLDPPLLDGIASCILGLAKRFKFIDRLTPAGRTQNRLALFNDHAYAFDYLSAKSLFKKVDPRCVNDYVRHGTQATQEGLKLTYSVATEVAIYRTLPTNIKSYKSPLKVTATLVYGDESNVVRPTLIKKIQNKKTMSTVKIAGGHLFPLECPEHTADAIQKIIEAL